MAILTYYRGVDFIKNYLVHYIGSILKAAQKGDLVLTNGFKQIAFSQEPTVVKRALLDHRPALPFVLIGPVRAEYIARSVAKDRLYTPEASETDQYYIAGGDIRLTVDMDVRANTADERDNLVDIVCLYLAHPDAKNYLLRHGIVIERSPTMSGEKEIYEPGIDHPVFASIVTVTVIGTWRVKTPIGYRFEELFLDIIAEMKI